jgi:hypothetical protein
LERLLTRRGHQTELAEIPEMLESESIEKADKALIYDDLTSKRIDFTRLMAEKVILLTGNPNRVPPGIQFVNMYEPGSVDEFMRMLTTWRLR